MSKEPFFIPRLAVVGVGLIGGSFALALREAGVVGTVVGIGRSLENLELAKELGVVDEFTRDPAEGVREADLVFLSVPVCSMGKVAAQVLPAMKPGAVLTDGGSVKGEVISQIEPLLQDGQVFVPGHPISGTEKSGAGAAFATLYRNKRCILTPVPQNPPEAVALVRHAWEAAGSEVVEMSVEKHDRILAAISHLPHMVAYSLVHAVGTYDRYEENILEYSAGGFRDFTRIASSDPTMWRDIALANKEALLEMLDRYRDSLDLLREDIAAEKSDEMYQLFLNAKQMRDEICLNKEKKHE